jgi:sterol desaturase/sphingolipid hydroxylase (fatty acid hydroxylase superfamily)
LNTASWLLQHEAIVRLGTFVTLLIAIRIGELRWRLRASVEGAGRQVTNVALLVLDTAMLRFAFPLLAVGLAVQMQQRGIGLFAQVDWPGGLELLLAWLLLDLAIYWQHRLMHLVPVLWRAHRVHHCDTAFDVTTGIRFHPFEIALSMAFKLVLVVALGPSPEAVILFEVVLSAASLFTHANFALPPSLDRAVRYVLVTPSMHRIHHSVRREETDSNFGFSLTLWDRLFSSYRAEPAQPETEMPIGLDEFRQPRGQRLPALLIQPFRSGSGNA